MTGSWFSAASRHLIFVPLADALRELQPGQTVEVEIRALVATLRAMRVLRALALARDLCCRGTSIWGSAEAGDYFLCF